MPLKKLNIKDLLQIPTYYVYVVLGKWFPVLDANNLARHSITDILGDFVKIVADNNKKYQKYQEMNV